MKESDSTEHLFTIGLEICKVDVGCLSVSLFNGRYLSAIHLLGLERMDLTHDRKEITKIADTDDKIFDANKIIFILSLILSPLFR
jgi:hypothetical protein